jgi:hypothetical protein
MLLAVLPLGKIICVFGMILCHREDRAAGERVNAIFWRYLREKLAHFWPVNPYNGHKGRTVNYSENFLSDRHFFM